MYLGAHVSISGKIYESVERAAALEATAMQIFSRSPRQWRTHQVSLKDACEFRRLRKARGIKVVAVHIPYLLNLATGTETLYQKSIEAYIEDMKETGLLGAEYLVTHMGSHKGIAEDEGLRRFVQALDVIFEETRNIKRVKLLLENTSGSGSWLGSTFDHHAFIFKTVKDSARLGVCLDTAHVFAAGHDIRKRSVVNALLSEIDNKAGKGSLKLVHLNDSMASLGSRVDRHQHIGEGYIGLKGLGHIVNHPSLKRIAFILETPKENPFDDRENLQRIRRLARKQKRG